MRQGETLWLLASRYNVSVDNIMKVNELPNPNQLLIGQAILIPTPGTTHTVQVGENLWSIAQSYGVSVNSIIMANKITNPNLLLPGTTLYIPPITHTVQPGETLWRIANRYQTTAQAIMNANNIQNPNIIVAGTQLLIPRKKPTIAVNAYTYQKDAAAAQTVNELGHLLTYLSPFAYIIKEDGTLQPFTDELMLEAARANNVTPMLSITNLSLTDVGTNLAHEVLSNPEVVERLITNILNVMDEKGYKGLNVDFEYVLPEDRENYNQFLQLVVDRLHPKGYFVSTAVAPKTSGAQEGLLYTAHDYEAHGRIVDFVMLMTYEWGWRGGPPQAISPINEMQKVVEYALSVMPADKIFLGFQIYARDWKIPRQVGDEAETFSAQEAIRRATQYNVPIQYDIATQSPFFRYVDEQGQAHEVWFEDARSAQAKFNLVKQYNLGGINYWVLGYPFPQNWALLEDNFEIQKRV